MARTRRCPYCRVDLRPLVHRGITLDACLECCGLWFDAQELERLLELPGPIFHTSRLQYTGSEPTRRPCPACGAKIRAQEIRPGGSVFDRCPDCRGLWLDFDAIRLLREEVVGPEETDNEPMERLKEQVRRALHSAHETWQDRRDKQTEQAVQALQRAGGFPAAESSTPSLWQLLEQWAREAQERDAASPARETAAPSAGSVAKDAASLAADLLLPFPLDILLGLALGLTGMTEPESGSAPRHHELDHKPSDWDKPWF